MKYVRILGIAFAMLCLSEAAMASSPSIVISEVQTGDTVSLSNEFVELYNPLPTVVDVSGWTLEYKSATGTTWSKKSTLAGTMKANGFYLLAPSTYLATADSSFSAGLSGTAGQVRIKDKTGVVVDTVAWGDTANAAETKPAAAPAAGETIERLPGRLIEDGGNATDTDDNSKDFVIRMVPNPQSTKSAIEVPSAAAVVVDDPVEDETGPVAKTYLPLMITELLPDPASPALDSKDEFIELFNPNSVDVDLAGYVLQAGSDFHDYYVIPSGTIGAGMYFALYSSDSHISLTNSGGAARVLDPSGNVVGTSNAYPKAETGASWSLVDNVWVWSTQATPEADNVLVEIVDEKPQATKPATAKTAAKPKTTTTKPKSTKVAAAKKETAPKTPKPKTSAASSLVAAVSSHGNWWLLVLALVLTLGLIAYEFRFNVQNYYILARRKFGARPENRSGLAGRGSHRASQ